VSELSAQTRRAIELVRTDPTISKAVETAPPLTQEQLAHLRSLIPPIGSHRLGDGGESRGDPSI